MTSILRTIKKLIIETTIAIRFATWKVEGTDVDNDAKVLFSDGLISINSQSKSMIHQLQADRYGFLVGDGEEIIKEHSLVDNDLFLGRIDNYLLFREGNLKLNCKELDLTATDINVNCDSININVANNITINGIVFSFVGNKVSIAGKEIAVIGGDVNLLSGKIIVSGQ